MGSPKLTLFVPLFFLLLMSILLAIQMAVRLVLLREASGGAAPLVESLYTVMLLVAVGAGAVCILTALRCARAAHVSKTPYPWQRLKKRTGLAALLFAIAAVLGAVTLFGTGVGVALTLAIPAGLLRWYVGFQK
jgi:hypothetical protein